MMDESVMAGIIKVVIKMLALLVAFLLGASMVEDKCLHIHDVPHGTIYSPEGGPGSLKASLVFATILSHRSSAPSMASCASRFSLSLNGEGSRLNKSVIFFPSLAHGITSRISSINSAALAYASLFASSTSPTVEPHPHRKLTSCSKSRRAVSVSSPSFSLAMQ